jgi:hypothetical protein
MKISDLQASVDRIRSRSVEDWANALYLAHREEFETTTVCNDGVVKYIHGKPTCTEPEDGEEISPGVFWRKAGALGPRPDLPDWKIRNNKARAAANERAMNRAWTNYE